MKVCLVEKVRLIGHGSMKEGICDCQHETERPEIETLAEKTRFIMLQLLHCAAQTFGLLLHRQNTENEAKWLQTPKYPLSNWPLAPAFGDWMLRVVLHLGSNDIPCHQRCWQSWFELGCFDPQCSVKPWGWWSFRFVTQLCGQGDVWICDVVIWDDNVVIWYVVFIVCFFLGWVIRVLGWNARKL